MQLKIQTDYAIRILLYLATVKRVANKKELCDALGIAKTYFPKIIVQLIEAKLIVSESGKDGGYRLIINPKDISLLNIMKVMEDTIKCNRCLDEDEYCSRNAVATCPVRKIYRGYQTLSEKHFSEISIYDLLQG